MGKKIFWVFLLGCLLIVFPVAAMAQHGHSHGSPGSAPRQKAPQHETAKKGAAQSVIVEALRITFEVMDMSEHMKHAPAAKGTHSASDHSKSHSLMVTLQDTSSKEIITDAQVSFMVLNPSGKKESAKLEWSGDHYGGGVGLREKGTYQVQFVIQSGGMERKAEFKYEAK